MVEETLTVLTAPPAPDLSPQVQALLGAAQLPPGTTYEQLRDEYLMEKYLK